MRSLWEDRHLGYLSPCIWILVLTYLLLALFDLGVLTTERKILNVILHASLVIALTSSQVQNVPEDETRTHKNTEQMNNRMSQTYFVKNHNPFPLNKIEKRNKDLTSEVIPTICHSKKVQTPKSLSKQAIFICFIHTQSISLCSKNSSWNSEKYILRVTSSRERLVTSKFLRDFR